MTTKRKSINISLLAIIIFAMLIICISIKAASAATVVNMGKVGEYQESITVSSSTLESEPYIKLIPKNTGSIWLTINPPSDDHYYYSYDCIPYSYKLYVKKDGEYQSISKKSTYTQHMNYSISVMKGKTYYIKICECDCTDTEAEECYDEYILAAECFPCPDTGGGKKSNAKNITDFDSFFGYEGVMHYHHAQDYWYKFNVKKKGNYWIGFYLSSEDHLMKKGATIALYKGSSSESVFKKTIGAVSKHDKRYKCQLPKGTYYIKVHSNSKYNNAYISLRVDSRK